MFTAFEYIVVKKQEKDQKDAPQILLKDTIMALDAQNARDLVVAKVVQQVFDVEKVDIQIRPFRVSQAVSAQF